MRAPRGWDEVYTFYGWRDSYVRDLGAWAAQMVTVSPPPGCKLYYDGDGDGILEPTELARGITIHPKLAVELAAALQELADAGLWSFLESTGGGYNFRRQRNGTQLSLHALGAAFDVDPKRNALRVSLERTALGVYPGTGVVEIMERRGWTWGGRWHRPDCMHFQFAKEV